MRAFSKKAGAPPVYKAQIPVWDKIADCQKLEWFHFMLPHEVLSSLLCFVSLVSLISFPGNPDMQNTFTSWLQSNDLSDMADRAVAIGIWGDSAQYFTRDLSLYILLFNILSGSVNCRFMIAAFGKRSLCQCGCLGKCTFEAVFQVIAYSLTSLKQGVMPDRRHDGSAFSDRLGDNLRAALAGSPLGLVGACIQRRGDWAWYS